MMDCWGLNMLLSGPPGTGKTMAAQVLAAELDAEIFRVDLSQVVSKYIGETEKQLDVLLNTAHEAGAVLLFDEADVVFGRRSEVRDARDRYANLEVGFLLQRIEEHDGIVLLSTNRKGDMDEAFRRRFQFVLSFPLPDPSLRARILERLLPWEACAEDIALATLAERFRLSGGELRNAVVAAAFLAASEGAKIGQGHLLKALRREVLSSGRALRAEEREDMPDNADAR
jgi:SpoVK/Ycf46/Vps4 family AAA+-type ATPase